MDFLGVWFRLSVLLGLSWYVVLSVEGNIVNNDNGRKPYEELSDLERRWYISRPFFSYHGYEVKLEYNISDSIDPNALDFKIYDGVECRHGSNEIEDYDNNYLSSSFDLIESSNATIAEGEVQTNVFLHGTFQQLEASFRIDTDKIRFTSLYQDYGAFQQVSFCVKIGALHEEVGWNETVEANWVQTPVIVQLKPLSFEVGESPFDMAYSSYETRSIEVEQCDTDSKVIDASDPQSKTEGVSVRLCVHAANTTLSEGGNLLYVEDFSYQRHNNTQLAIKPHTGGEPAPASAPLECDLDSNVCSFDTVLGPEFFSSAGVVNGYGTAMLQFDAINDPTEGAVGDSGDYKPRIVPVRFGLKMVALPSEDEEATNEGKFSRKNIIVALVSAFCILWFIKVMCRCTTMFKAI